jgi:hypothetical protein
MWKSSRVSVIAIRAAGTHRYKRHKGEHSGIDTTLQIRLFVKLKLSWCARAGDRAGLLFGATCRGAARICAPRASRMLLPMIPALVLRIDIHCYLRLIAAHVLVFAREISRSCNFHCCLQ